MSGFSMTVKQIRNLAEARGLECETSRPGDGTRRYCFTDCGGARNVSPVLSGAKEATIWLYGYGGGYDRGWDACIAAIKRDEKVEPRSLPG